MKILRALILATAAITGAALSGGCTTEGYCFDQCDGEGGGGAGAVGGVGGAAGSFGGDGGSGFDTDSGAGGGNCMPSNEGIEVCDGEDNDCDNLIDESPDIDFTDPRHCGSCELNCTLDLSRVTTPVCVPPPDDQLGQQVGTCDYDTCAPNFFDVDGSRENGCEYYCQWNPAGTNTTDPGGIQGCKIDDDCDGQIDEDVDTCGQLDNCGDCGNACVTPHATPVCVTTAAAGTACTPGKSGEQEWERQRRTREWRGRLE